MGVFFFFLSNFRNWRRDGEARTRRGGLVGVGSHGKRGSRITGNGGCCRAGGA